MPATATTAGAILGRLRSRTDVASSASSYPDFRNSRVISPIFGAITHANVCFLYTLILYLLVVPTLPVDLAEESCMLWLHVLASEKNESKDGKEHRYWSIVESCRNLDGRVVQRQVLYLGEINDSQKVAWCRTIEVLQTDSRAKQVALFPTDRQAPELDCEVVQVKLNELMSAREQTVRGRNAAITTHGELPDVSGNLFNDLHTAVSMRENGVRRTCTSDTRLSSIPVCQRRRSLAIEVDSGVPLPTRSPLKHKEGTGR